MGVHDVFFYNSLGLTSSMTATQRSSGTPSSLPQPQQAPPPHAYPPSYSHAGPPPGVPPYSVPQPSNSGSIDLSNIRPVNSGSVSLADAVSKARGIAADNGLVYGGRDDGMAGRHFRRSRTRSRSPPRMIQGFRDNYNPYRDERRDDPRRPNHMPYGRERTYSPDNRAPPLGARFTPPPGRGFGGPDERSVMGRRGGDDSGVEIIPIEANVVGLIIGRQGETLRRVEAESGTRIQFMTGAETSGPMRQCKITGPRMARDDAKADIFRIIEENGKALGSGRAPPPPDRNMDGGMGSGMKQAGAHQPALRMGEDATQIMVPNRTVGLIIGRGGETIRDLQERSQCHVNIVGEEKSVNGLRPVNLIGTPSAAAMAKELIMEIVESDTKSQANQQGGMPRDIPGMPAMGGGGEKINDRIIVPSEAVGMIIGKGWLSPYL